MNVVDVYPPDGPTRGAVAMIHGGFWNVAYGREGLADHCRDLARQGFVAGNVAYRRVGERGGGFPNTANDVVAGLQSFAKVHGPLVAVVGHSAGGQLALWAAKELPSPPRVVVTVAGVNDLVLAYEFPAGARGVAAYTANDPKLLAAADPMKRLPLGVRSVLISPVDDFGPNRDLSSSYAAAARAAGDDVELIDVAGDHFALIDTGSAVWAAVVAAITAAASA